MSKIDFSAITVHLNLILWSAPLQDLTRNNRMNGKMLFMIVNARYHTFWIAVHERSLNDIFLNNPVPLILVIVPFCPVLSNSFSHKCQSRSCLKQTFFSSVFSRPTYESSRKRLRDESGACTVKLFTVVIYRFFMISQSICPWQAFPACSSVCGRGQRPYF